MPAVTWIARGLDRRNQSSELAVVTVLENRSMSPVLGTLACLGVASVCEFGTSDTDVCSINDASGSAMQSVLEKLVTEAKARRKIRPSLDPATTAGYLQATLAGMRVTARAGASLEALKAIARIAVDGLKSH
jgi:TetR/AcrR family transcriptional regulator, transcriptional repressor for nem operon